MVWLPGPAPAHAQLRRCAADMYLSESEVAQGRPQFRDRTWQILTRSFQIFQRRHWDKVSPLQTNFAGSRTVSIVLSAAQVCRVCIPSPSAVGL